jgi:hypothetical protein
MCLGAHALGVVGHFRRARNRAIALPRFFRDVDFLRDLDPDRRAGVAPESCIRPGDGVRAAPCVRRPIGERVHAIERLRRPPLQSNPSGHGAGTLRRVDALYARLPTGTARRTGDRRGSSAPAVSRSSEGGHHRGERKGQLRPLAVGRNVLDGRRGRNGEAHATSEAAHGSRSVASNRGADPGCSARFERPGEARASQAGQGMQRGHEWRRVCGLREGRRRARQRDRGVRPFGGCAPAPRRRSLRTIGFREERALPRRRAVRTRRRAGAT